MAERVAVVTGANRGIGHEIARRLVAARLDVIATGREPGGRKEAAAAIGARYLPLEVTDRASINALAENLRDGFDVLINNAGITMQGFDASVAKGTLAVNFFGAMNVTD